MGVCLCAHASVLRHSLIEQTFLSTSSAPDTATGMEGTANSRQNQLGRCPRGADVLGEEAQELLCVCQCGLGGVRVMRGSVWVGGLDRGWA